MITPECIVHRDLARLRRRRAPGRQCARGAASSRGMPRTVPPRSPTFDRSATRCAQTIPSESVPPELDGLASTVISRTRAESAESWPGIFRRAQEDWHWVIVGAGAIAATFVSTLVLSAILAFGPKPDRADSISAFYTNFRTPAGDLYLLATPAGRDQEPIWVNENGGPAASARVVHATWFVDTRAHGSRSGGCASGRRDRRRSHAGAESHVATTPSPDRVAARRNQPIPHDRANSAGCLPGRPPGAARGLGQRHGERALDFAVKLEVRSQKLEVTDAAASSNF